MPPVPDSDEIAQRWITRWSIARASTPGVLSVSLVLAGQTECGTERPHTHHLLLAVESAAEFMNGLNRVLENAAAVGSPERWEASSTEVAATRQAPDSSGTNASEDSASQSNHFELGAYGLFGN